MFILSDYCKRRVSDTGCQRAPTPTQTELCRTWSQHHDSLVRLGRVLRLDRLEGHAHSTSPPRPLRLDYHYHHLRFHHRHDYKAGAPRCPRATCPRWRGHTQGSGRQQRDRRFDAARRQWQRLITAPVRPSDSIPGAVVAVRIVVAFLSLATVLDY